MDIYGYLWQIYQNQKRCLNEARNLKTGQKLHLAGGFSAAVVSFLVFLLVHDSPRAAAAAKAAKAAKAKAAAAPAMPGSTEDQLSDLEKSQGWLGWGAMVIPSGNFTVCY